MNRGVGLVGSAEPELAVVVEASLTEASVVDAGDEGHVELSLDIALGYKRVGCDIWCLSAKSLGQESGPRGLWWWDEQENCRVVEWRHPCKSRTPQDTQFFRKQLQELTRL